MPFIIRETRYLAAPPMKLPAPTSAIFLMISENIEFRFIDVKIASFDRFSKQTSVHIRGTCGTQLIDYQQKSTKSPLLFRRGGL
ncbi:MAG: hypothetical protein IJQ22_04050, partial [Bacteroidales bacterium]|nr:hypothetical protein [Bacteroidales bacterium]